MEKIRKEQEKKEERLTKSTHNTLHYDNYLITFAKVKALLLNSKKRIK